ncbi:transglycosylase SLT domain-containing protein [Escherichia coli]
MLDPETNINIGTSYLQYVYQQFGNNRIFSSAAYNADQGGCEPGLATAPGVSTQWHSSRVFHLQRAVM